ncbi:MAG: hypothetical protein Q4C11_01155 [Clostridium sp.]|nr:hypothetical protein [Clostridium sp.]
MNNNQQPNYVLKFNETDSRKVKDRNYYIKKAVVIIIAIIVIFSIIFGENLFLELSWTARILLIAIALGILFTGKKEDVPSPAELRFYDDYLLLFLERKYYSEKSIKQEYLKMKYSDITKVKYLPNTSNKRFQIYGNGHSLHYDVKKDGSLSIQPSRDKMFEEGMIYFSTNLNQNIDFIKEIEEHSPLKVEIDNTNF